MTGPGVGWASAEGVALTIRPHGRRGSNKVPDSPARGMALLRSPSVRQDSWFRRPLPILRSRGVRLASAPLIYFHFTYSR